jgi:HEPN domain-containing protein
LVELVGRQQISGQWQSIVQELAELSQPLGPQLHVQTDYGDEHTGRLPWELFGEEDARDAVTVAEALIRRVEALMQEVSRE